MEDETPVIAVVLASPTSEADVMAVDDLRVESELEQDPRPDPEKDVEPTPVIVEIPRQDPELNVDLPRPDPAVEGTSSKAGSPPPPRYPEDIYPRWVQLCLAHRPKQPAPPPLQPRGQGQNE